MIITNQYPPNYDIIRKKFGGNAIRGAVFTYGHHIFSPNGVDLSKDLVAHEEEHYRQQQMAGSPDNWWKHYLENKNFRYNQELAAYIAQYRYAVEHYPRSAADNLLKRISKDLSSPMYGNIVSRKEAQAKIVEGAR